MVTRRFTIIEKDKLLPFFENHSRILWSCDLGEPYFLRVRSHERSVNGQICILGQGGSYRDSTSLHPTRYLIFLRQSYLECDSKKGSPHFIGRHETV